MRAAARKARSCCIWRWRSCATVSSLGLLLRSCWRWWRGAVDRDSSVDSLGCLDGILLLLLLLFSPPAVTLEDAASSEERNEGRRKSPIRNTMVVVVEWWWWWLCEREAMMTDVVLRKFWNCLKLMMMLLYGSSTATEMNQRWMTEMKWWEANRHECLFLLWKWKEKWLCDNSLFLSRPWPRRFYSKTDEAWFIFTLDTDCSASNHFLRGLRSKCPVWIRPVTSGNDGAPLFHS